MQIEVTKDLSHVDIVDERGILLYFLIRILMEHGNEFIVQSVTNEDYIGYGIEFDGDKLLPNKPITLKLTIPEVK